MQENCLKLQEYERIAVRYLSKNLPSVRRNPDYINQLIYYMLKSDVTYINGIGSLEGRRMTYAKFAVQHIRDSLRRKKNRVYSLDKEMVGEKSRTESSGSQLSYNDFTPPEQVEFNEILDYIDGPELSSIESCAIREYFLEKVSIKDIAAKYGLTRQAIYLAIDRGLEKVKKEYGEEESST